MARKSGMLTKIKRAATATSRALKTVDHLCKRDRCTACGSLGPVQWIDQQSYGKDCGHASKMRTAGGTTVKKAIERDGHARAAMPPKPRGKSGGPITRGRHRK
jgi:hypothetical protein